MVDDGDNYLVAFSTVPGIGPARLNLLIKYFGTPVKAWEATEPELTRTGLPKDVLRELLSQKNKLDIHSYIQGLIKRKIKFLTIHDKDFPERLKNIPDPPTVLFIKENADNFISLSSAEKVIGVVGTRKMTSYGETVTEQLVSGLVSAGFVVVSGMALGVDGVAHQATINSGGKTIAVLGAGVEIIYPREHTALYNSILDHGGAIVSEVAPEKTVIRGIFPARNRIISGLSQAILVTEGALDSGSLITAKAALEQGREVFAVPGPINSPMAEGTNFLIKQGAKVVTSVGDILEGLGYEPNVMSNGVKGKTTVVGDTPNEQKIIDLLINEVLEFNDIVKKSGILAKDLGEILGIMEIKQKINMTNGRYSL